MKNSNKVKNILLIILILIIIGLAIGYAALSQTLTINGTANIKSTWDVEITSIVASSTNLTNGATDETAPTFTATTATFNVNLAQPGSTATYTITVENKGTINAKLNSITDLTTINTTEPSDVSYTITALKDDPLTAGTSKTYDITVTWAANSTSVPTTKTKTATIVLDYIQAD